MPEKVLYKDGFKYQLYLEHYHKLVCGVRATKKFDSDFISIDGTNLIIRRGYAWDGPSGPTVDTATFMRGSLVHDALYQLIREGAISEDSKDAADMELRYICLEDGMWSARAWWVYKGVRMFGRGASRAGSGKPILMAP
jgi:hypothetical protein